MIRRPLLYVVLGQMAGILTGYYCNKAVLMACVLVAALIGIYSFIFVKMEENPEENLYKRRRVAALIAIAFALGSFCFCIADKKVLNQGEKLTSKSSFSGRVTDAEHRTNSAGESYIQLTVRELSGGLCSSSRMIIKCFEETGEELPAPGSVIAVKGNPEDPSGKRNPGCFDYSLYLKSMGVSAVMTAENIEVAEPSRTFSGKLFMLKESFADRLYDVCGKDGAAMITAILFGDKGELDGDILDVFQRNGTAHILAVSGLHIGIIYGSILKIWPGRRNWIFFCFTCFFFGCYVILAGFSPSVVRAVSMVLIHSFASLTGRRYDLDNAAFSVAAAVLAARPFMLFNSGFQMSFLAVLTLTVVLPYIKNFYSGIFMTSLAIQIGLGPFICYNFNYISLIAVVINVPVVFMAGIIVPLGLIAIVFQTTPLFAPLAWATDVLCDILTLMNKIAEIPGVTTFQVPSSPLWVITAYYLGLLAFATEEGRLAVIRASAKAVYILKVSLLIIILSLAFGHLAGDDFKKCNVTFVDVGQGDCICMRTDSGVYMFDGGGSENYSVGKQVLRPYLLKNGMSHVDGAFVTHLHTDHYRGVCELAREGMVEKLYIYEANRLREEELIKETGLSEENIVYLSAGQKVKLGEDCSVDVLWPVRRTESEYLRLTIDEENENDLSLIMKADIRGKSILVTGDIDEKCEQDLMGERKDLLAADILKVAHHGSKYSTSENFLDAVSPEIAVIQVGKNMYGHPTPEVLKRLEGMSVPVYRNDVHGAVGLEIEKGEIKKIRRMICN